MKNILGLFEIVKEDISILNDRQKKQAVSLVFLLLFSSMLELLGVSAIVPFIQAIIAPEQLLGNRYVYELWKGVGLTDYNSVILIMGVALIAVYLFKNFFIILISHKRFTYTTQWQKDISIRMLRSYMLRPYSFYLNSNSAEVLRGCSSDVTNWNSSINQFFVLVTESVTVLIIGIYLIYIDIFTAISAIILVCLVFLGIMLILRPKVKMAGRMNFISSTEINKSITQTVQGIKDILVKQRREYFIEAYEKAAENVRISTRNYNTVSVMPDRITEGICVGGVIGIVIVRLFIGGDSTETFIPKLAAFAMASFKILPSVGKISNSLNTMMFARPGQHNAYINIKEIEENDTKETGMKVKYGKVSQIDIEEANKIAEGSFEVSLDDIWWKYNENQAWILKGLSLNFSKGESIGIVGTSGGGKTTTIDILLGLLQAQCGNVTINGRSIYEMPFVWAQLVAYVPQNVFLLDDTVRANVLFGSDGITDEEIWDILERAQLREFIHTLPKGLDTEVGERGIRFSGGQRQRIAIARALISNPQILVMDEATAALDNETEEAVMDAIEVLQGHITLVIVAHRLTTIRNCDKVYEIDNGRANEIKNNG